MKTAAEWDEHDRRIMADVKHQIERLGLADEKEVEDAADTLKGIVATLLHRVRTAASSGDA